MDARPHERNAGPNFPNFSPNGPTPPQTPESRRRFLPEGVEILHEDEDLIIIDKPPGLLTVDLEDKGRENVFDLVKRHVRDMARKRGTKVWVIHRLDKEASGLIVFAKTQKAFHWLKEDFKAKRVHRLYAAVVEGEVPVPPGANASTDDPAQNPGQEPGTDGNAESAKPAKGRRVVQMPSGVIQSFLQEGYDGVVRSVPGPTSGRAPVHVDDDAIGDGPRHAITHWKVQEVGSGRTLLQIRLETGRKNQIRAHMREFGRPIVGDRRYGSETDPLGRVCLHAFELGFTNPLNGKQLRFRSPTPGSFFGLVGKNPGSASRIAKEIGEPIPAPTKASQPVAPAATLPPAATPTPVPAAPAVRVTKADLSNAGSDRPIAAARTPDVATPERAPLAKDPSGQSWDHVAEWYDELIEDRKSDHHERVIIPGTIRLLGDVSNKRVLDLACGQGVLSRQLVELGARVVGVDASPRLIESAIRLGWANGPATGASTHAEPSDEIAATRLRYLVGDARSLDPATVLGNGPAFDLAACVMALMNIEPLSPVMEGLSKCLAPGGRFVGVILHPAFRAPGQTSWGWEKLGDASTPSGAPQRTGPQKGRGHKGKPAYLPREERRASIAVRQYRRVDGYLSLGQRSIVMNPGAAAHGRDAITTVTYHRPIQAYVKAFAEAGFLLDGFEEWTSMRVSEPGPRAAEEDRSRREIPMFLALRGVRMS